MWFLGKLNNIFCTESQSDDSTTKYVHVMYVYATGTLLFIV